MPKSKQVMVNGRAYPQDTLTIEPAYSKYANPSGEGFALYHHFTYPNSSVLAGQRGRQYLEGADTLLELTTKYPTVEDQANSSYIDPDTVQPSGSPEDYEEPWDENDY